MPNEEFYKDVYAKMALNQDSILSKRLEESERGEKFSDAKRLAKYHELLIIEKAQEHFENLTTNPYSEINHRNTQNDYMLFCLASQFFTNRDTATIINRWEHLENKGSTDFSDIPALLNKSQTNLVIFGFFNESETLIPVIIDKKNRSILILNNSLESKEDILGLLEILPDFNVELVLEKDQILPTQNLRDFDYFRNCANVAFNVLRLTEKDPDVLRELLIYKTEELFSCDVDLEENPIEFAQNFCAMKVKEQLKIQDLQIKTAQDLFLAIQKPMFDMMAFEENEDYETNQNLVIEYALEDKDDDVIEYLQSMLSCQLDDEIIEYVREICQNLRNCQELLNEEAKVLESIMIIAINLQNIRDRVLTQTKQPPQKKFKEDHLSQNHLAQKKQQLIINDEVVEKILPLFSMLAIDEDIQKEYQEFILASEKQYCDLEFLKKFTFLEKFINKEKRPTKKSELPPEENSETETRSKKRDTSAEKREELVRVKELEKYRDQYTKIVSDFFISKREREELSTKIKSGAKIVFDISDNSDGKISKMFEYVMNFALQQEDAIEAKEKRYQIPPATSVHNFLTQQMMGNLTTQSIL